MKRLFYLTALAGITMVSCAKPNDGTKVTKTYPVSVFAGRQTDESSGTRIENIDGIDHWSVGDKIGIYVFSERTMEETLNVQYDEGYKGDLHVDYSPVDLMNGIRSFISFNGFSRSVIANFAMTGLHGEPVPTTDFGGTLTYDQISLLDPNGVYDYIAYYPYANFVDPITMLLSLLAPPSEISVRRNVFPGHLARLFGTVHINSTPLTWLDENEEQQWNERKVFNYGHTMSYLRLKLTGNRVNPDVPVVGITLNITSLEYNVDGAGVVSVMIRNTVKVNIEDGMNVDDYIFIPISPSESTNYDTVNLNFEFTFEDGTTWSTVVQGGRTEMGKVHPISFNLI